MTTETKVEPLACLSAQFVCSKASLVGSAADGSCLIPSPQCCPSSVVIVKKDITFVKAGSNEYLSWRKGTLWNNLHHRMKHLNIATLFAFVREIIHNDECSRAKQSCFLLLPPNTLVGLAAIITTKKVLKLNSFEV